jgi:chaperonin cofactor prefoldin
MNSDELPTPEQKLTPLPELRIESSEPVTEPDVAIDLAAEVSIEEIPADRLQDAALPMPGEEPVDVPPMREPVRSLAVQDEEVDLAQRVAALRQQEQTLQQDIAKLQTAHTTMLREQMVESQVILGRLVKEGLSELEQRKQTLQIAIEQLERRQERIRAEMRSTFAGASQDLAIRVQGFKDYLVGSLQDLATSAERLELVAPVREPDPMVKEPRESRESREQSSEPLTPRFAESTFQDQTRQIRKLLDQYRSSPDYYGPPWQLRRTFEPVHAERVANWFFSQGGRGAVRTMGSRLQNILIVSAAVSVLRKLYGERLRTLVLANSPERLGEWRRGLQDCLGVSRADFGSEQGLVLFEAPEPLAQRADRLVKRGLLPLIIIDEAEDQISLALLQFPLWLAIAADPNLPTVL